MSQVQMYWLIYEMVMAYWVCGSTLTQTGWLEQVLWHLWTAAPSGRLHASAYPVETTLTTNNEDIDLWYHFRTNIFHVSSWTKRTSDTSFGSHSFHLRTSMLNLLTTFPFTPVHIAIEILQTSIVWTSLYFFNKIYY